MENPVKQALVKLESVLCDPEGKPTVVGASDEDNSIINQALGILRSVVNTGVVFRGHPVLLGPRNLDGHRPDQLTLTRLDRFLRKHFPGFAGAIADNETLVDAATPPTLEPEEP